MNIFLTIDDAPSKHMKKKVDFLSARKIPAVFFCRGEFMPRHEEFVIEAIQKGFLIGNHSFTHHYFSEIPLEQCFDEILKTEKLIEACYEKANSQRPSKAFRFPFGDRGGKEKGLNVERDKVQKLQNFLKELGFEPLDFNPKTPDKFIDALWDWDTEDYKENLIKNPDEYQKKLEEFWEKSKDKTHVLLHHDFDHTHHLFEITMNFLFEKRVQFLPIKAKKT
ncbi:MAG: hypothetical protein B7Y25_06450 [Alphaproteobacteria bacterium 16-39-46]|nr:MAG: hypothetical protein B7Y25_06450 [Alphaproteobacteria bacterium 16-39-46]OZA42277.1 MAG: hypothetical protein B7X84_06520 [Alphaproteobacteria bacterium 17-39-52]HQS84054.1 polysaccharide deacetylase family protein [Alphaproteobacteria bacterium]HQS93916.1 polysaccharide deacetylase family protein [Alphaproteobacteria bacterium]